MSQSETSNMVELCATDEFDYNTCQTMKHPLVLGMEVGFRPAGPGLLMLEIQERCKRCGRIYGSQLVPIERSTIQEALALPDATKPAFKSPPCSGDRADLRPTGAPPPKTAGWKHQVRHVLISDQ